MSKTDGMGMDRRGLMKAAAMAAGAAVAGACSEAGRSGPGAALEMADTVLFQGDSITDAGRDRDRQQQANHSGALGKGYPFLIGSQLLRDHRRLDLKIYNRGISGNKVPDLAARWQPDCVDLGPALLSILIGVNDIWHKLEGRYDGGVQEYEDGLTTLLGQTHERLPDVQIVLCEPFVLRCGAVDERWFPEFTQRREAARTAAQANKLLWVPFQTMFDEAVAGGTPPAYWAADGVHPTPAGHSLMAQTWRAVVGI